MFMVHVQAQYLDTPRQGHEQDFTVARLWQNLSSRSSIREDASAFYRHEELNFARTARKMSALISPCLRLPRFATVLPMKPRSKGKSLQRRLDHLDEAQRGNRQGATSPRGQHEPTSRQALVNERHRHQQALALLCCNTDAELE